MLQLGTPPLVAPVNTCFRFAGYGQRARRSESERARTLRNYFIERNCFWLWIVCYFAAANYFLWLPKHRLQGLPRRSPPPCSLALAREAVAAVAAVATAAAVAAVFQI